MFQKAVNFLFPPELNLIHDEGGFLNFLLGGAQLAAPWLGKAFGSQAPGEQDLTQDLQDTGKMTRDAMQQAQDLRRDSVQDSDALKEIQVRNGRRVGAFDPTSFGPEFGFLQGQQGQFAGADFGASGIEKAFNRKMQIGNQAAAIGSQSPSTQLGINQLLTQQAGMAGSGFGGALGDTLGILGNQQMLGTGLFDGQGSVLDRLFAGGDATGPGGDMSEADLLNFANMGKGGGANSLQQADPNAEMRQMIESSPLIQMIIKDIIFGRE